MKDPQEEREPQYESRTLEVKDEHFGEDFKEFIWMLMAANFPNWGTLKMTYPVTEKDFDNYVVENLIRYYCEHEDHFDDDDMEEYEVTDISFKINYTESEGRKNIWMEAEFQYTATLDEEYLIDQQEAAEEDYYDGIREERRLCGRDESDFLFEEDEVQYNTYTEASYWYAFYHKDDIKLMMTLELSEPEKVVYLNDMKLLGGGDSLDTASNMVWDGVVPADVAIVRWRKVDVNGAFNLLIDPVVMTKGGEQDG